MGLDDAPIGADGEQFVHVNSGALVGPGGHITGCPLTIEPHGTNIAAPLTGCPDGVGNDAPVL
jgi:hypothetical protein